MRIVLFCLSLMLSATPCLPQEALGLAAPAELVQSGLLKHILPRFSLKTGVRVVADPGGPMVLATAPPGDPVFQGPAGIYYLRTDGSDRQQRFRDWLLSDIGKRTVEQFQPETGPAFSAHFEIAKPVVTVDFTGDAVRGGTLSLTHCGRCHVIGDQNRMAGLGSTPSFPVLRALPDWADRFQQFYVLNPHPSFTQISGVTAPFSPERPPPVVPVTISLEDLEAILAFVQATEAADLGAPLQLQ